MRQCPGCGEESPARARFCPWCATPLDPDGPTADTRKTVTVLFCDVTGYTRLGERLDPESLRTVMSRFFSQVREILHRHGGTVEKFIGDAVMAVFGVPVLHEDDALRAVRAALEIGSGIRELNVALHHDLGVRLQTRTGVNTGEVVVGQPAKGGGVATGDALTVAARLEQAAAPDEIVIAESTLRLLGGLVSVEPLGPLAVPGKSKPLSAFRLTGWAEGARVTADRLSAPMVGRQRYLAKLCDALAQVEEECTCHLFTVLGAAGVGKTRLLRDFTAAVAGRATVLTGRCRPYGEGITYWPLMEMVGQAADLDGSRSADEGRQRLAGLFNDVPAASAIIDRLAPLVGLGGQQDNTEHNFRAVRVLAATLARELPLVLVFDDIHWAEPTLLDMIEDLADWSRDAPILIVCLARSEFFDSRPTWGGGKVNATTTLLQPLSGDHSRELLRRLLGSDDLDPRLEDRITETAAGNPLFVEQMLAAMIDDGLLRRSGPTWTADADVTAVPVPPTIASLLAARLDRLPADERRVIERAAVVGTTFQLDAVAELSSPGASRAEVLGSCLSLVRKELLHSDGVEPSGQELFRFSHALLRDSAYAATSKHLRAELHERFADWLERNLDAQAEQYAELIGYHLEQAHGFGAELRLRDDHRETIARRAAEHLISAAGRVRGGDRPAAAGLLRRAAHLLPEADPTRLSAQIDLGQVLLGLGEFDEAGTILEQTVAHAEQIGNERLRAYARLMHLRVMFQLSPDDLVKVALDEASRCLVSFIAAGDDAGAARALRARAAAYTAHGSYEKAEQALEAALGPATRAGDDRAVRLIRREIASLLSWSPRSVPEAIRRSRALLADGGDDPALRREVLAQLAVLTAAAGDPAEAGRLLRQAEAVLDESTENRAVPYDARFGGFYVAPVALLSGDLRGAERELRRSCLELQRSRERGYLASRAAALADVLYQLGCYDDAATFASIAAGAAASNNHMPAQAGWRAVQAKLISARGRHDEALALARTAAEFAQQTDDRDCRARVRLTMGAVLAAAGRTGEARRQVGRALSMYEEAGHVAGAALARAHLAAVGGSPSRVAAARAVSAAGAGSGAGRGGDGGQTVPVTGIQTSPTTVVLPPASPALPPPPASPPVTTRRQG